MLGPLVNKSRTSFVQQDEHNDEEIPSAPASLPSVPSFGAEEWCHSRFDAMTDPSTTSASPMSPCFPGFASNGSSVVGLSRATHRATQ